MLASNVGGHQMTNTAIVVIALLTIASYRD